MWITANGEQELDRICNNNQLTKKELDAVAAYNGHRNVRKLDPDNKGPARPLIDEIQDILKRYAGYTDPPEE